jgi:hypothetical protein
MQTPSQGPNLFSFRLIVRNGIPTVFLFCKMIRSGILSIFIFPGMIRNGIPSIFIFRGMVWNKIMKFSFALLYLLSNMDEKNVCRMEMKEVKIVFAKILFV